MAFQRDFNELLNEILTSYKDQFPDVSATQGAVLFLKASCTASMLWGLYQQLDRVSEQIFVESADRAHKERHAAEFGIATAGKTDAQIVDEVLAAKRSRLAGGNRYDYAAWAREVTLGDEFVTSATVVDLAQGEGTMDVVVVTNRISASREILAKIKTVLQSKRPIGSGFSWGMRVVGVGVRDEIITIVGKGANWNKEATEQAAVAYVDSLEPGRPLVRGVLIALALEYGADTADVPVPAADLSPVWNPSRAHYTVFGSSNITVKEAP
jgi:uncharacterized phage protein gp47/JayE